MRNEYDRTDDHCGKCTEEYRSCRNILRVARVGVLIGGGEVDVDLNRGIDRLGDEDEPDSENKEHPLISRNVEMPAKKDGEECRHGMHPGIVCTTHEDVNTSTCVSEALRALHNGKSFPLGYGYSAHESIIANEKDSAGCFLFDKSNFSFARIHS